MIVTEDMLRAAIDQGQEPDQDQDQGAEKAQDTGHGQDNGQGRAQASSGKKYGFDVRKYLEQHGLTVTKEKAHAGGTLFVLGTCPFDASHTAGESAVFRAASGMLSFQCFHSSCKGRTWHDLRRSVGDEAKKDKSKPKGDGARRGLFEFFDPEQHRAGSLLDGPLLPLDWVFDNSLLSQTVGYVAGPPAAGKSQFLLQATCAVATGEPAFIGGLWALPKPRPVLFICAEDDARILQRRLRRIVDNQKHDTGNLTLSPARVEELLRQNLYVVPAAGEDLRLVRKDGANPEASETYQQISAAAARIPNLGLLVIDPLSRFYGADENDNTVATYFNSLLERIANERNCTVLCVHHTSKKAAIVSGKFNLEAALSADAMRGASGLTGACRWQFNLTGLPAAFAKERLGLIGQDGTFLAGKVSKKSYGPPEEQFYLERLRGGLLWPVEGSGRAQDVDAQAAVLAWLKAKIKNQAAQGLPGLTIRTAKECWREVATATVTKTMVGSVAEQAVLNGDLLLVAGKNASGKRVEFLRLVDEPEKSEPAVPMEPAEPAEPAAAYDFT